MLKCQLKESLHVIFDPCCVRVNTDSLCVTFENSEYEIWVTPTALRNNIEILQKIRRDPCPEGSCREWLRYGYVIIAEKYGHERCIQIEIFPWKKV